MTTTLLLQITLLLAVDPSPVASAVPIPGWTPADFDAAVAKCARTEVFPGFEDQRDAIVIVRDDEVLPPGVGLASLGSSAVASIELLCWDSGTGRFDTWTEGDPQTRGIPVVWARSNEVYRDIRTAAAVAIRAQQASWEATGSWIDDLEALGMTGIDGVRTRLTVWEDHWSLALATDYQTCNVGDGIRLEDDVLPSRLTRVGACVTWYDRVEASLKTAWDAAVAARDSGSPVR